MSADAAPSRFLFLFIDGVGLGSDDTTTNPLAKARMPHLRSLLGGAPTGSTPPRDAPALTYRQLDARLGHAGLPQSATGQTALLTGRNGADVMDGHYGPWPGPTLRDVLKDGTLFHVAPGAPHFANVYPPGYFRALEAGRARVNVPVFAARSAGVELLDLEDYREGRGIAADLTGAYFHEIDPLLECIEPAQTGRRLAHEARDTHLAFFDLWLTDRIGHRGTFAEAIAFAEQLDAFIGGLVAALDGVTLVVTSDHGNFEDKTVRTHTLNPVPMLAVGPASGRFAEAASILDVYPAICSAWEG